MSTNKGGNNDNVLKNGGVISEQGCMCQVTDDLFNCSGPLDAQSRCDCEKIIYVTCIHPAGQKPDYLAVVDVDRNSETFCQIIYRLHTSMPHLGDELHHFGWNHCVGCRDYCSGGTAKRTHLLLPSLHSSRVYVVNVAHDPKKPVLEKTIDLTDFGVTFPHTTHCLPNGQVMISYLGDKNNDATGNFVLFNGDTFKYEGKWAEQDVPYGYDFWYQPRLEIMVSSEWGSPKIIKTGLNPAELDKYGTSLHFWQWKERKLLKSVNLGVEDGSMPLEVRFCHDPNSCHGYVASAIGSSVFHFYKNEAGEWTVDRVVKAKPLKVEGWALPDMPAVLTDFLISMDDKYMYVSAWMQGFVQQYDITDKVCPKLKGQVYIGGSIVKGGPVKVLDEGFVQPDPLVVKGRTIDGGAQMLQLSLDGRRLYVTTSLYSIWDKQFYPNLVKNGACMVRLNVDTVNGGMKVDETFLIDFGKEPDGPVLAHEMRYPGGDCTSDIFS